MSLPRYPDYKDSGVQWLGALPAHWTWCHSRRMFRVRDEPACESDTHLTASQKHGMIPQAEFIELEGRRVVEVLRWKEKLLHVEPNDFVMTLRSFEGGIEWSQLRGATGYSYVILKPVKDVVPRFFAYLFKSAVYIQALRTTTDLVRDGQALRFSHFVQVPLPVVPQTEQTAIAAFLDRETAKIDALVAEQERLIELLKEKRQAVISHAVTKGLNPKAPMKDSGVEWLGEIPAHWRMVPLHCLTDPDRPIMYGIVLPGPDVEVGIPILKGGNVKPSRMNLEAMARTTPEIEAPYARARLRAGDLVYSIRGSIGDCERVPASLEGSNITQDVARVAIGADAHPGWARWALLAPEVRSDLASGSLGAAVRGINIFDLKRVRIPTPPQPEQVAIAAFLDRHIANFDTLSIEAQRAIDLLQERRTALISAAVTGQIDVRDDSAQPRTDRRSTSRPPRGSAIGAAGLD